MIEFELLRSFVAVAECGGFTARQHSVSRDAVAVLEPRTAARANHLASGQEVRDGPGAQRTCATRLPPASTTAVFIAQRGTRLSLQHF
jgi:hypothetical protein